jgi:predicted enzyme related to lactoylglutathione lyase
MPPSDAHDPGTICWIDLASTDAAGATEFYCELFGWTATEPIESAGGYRILLHEGREVAGLAPVWGDTDRSAWSTYVASHDTDAACAAAQAAGGDVVMEPMDVLSAGRTAILRDPGGALISLWEAGDHAGFEARGDPGPPVWTELVTRDLASSQGFYRSVFGWTPDEDAVTGGYMLWRRRERAVAGALALDERWPAGVAPHWLVHFATPDPDATARRCEALGGRVTQPPANAGAGRCALLEDPAGAAFAVTALRLRPGGA